MSATAARYPCRQPSHLVGEITHDPSPARDVNLRYGVFGKARRKSVRFCPEPEEFGAVGALDSSAIAGFFLTCKMKWQMGPSSGLPNRSRCGGISRSAQTIARR